MQKSPEPFSRESEKKKSERWKWKEKARERLKAEMTSEVLLMT